MTLLLLFIFAAICWLSGYVAGTVLAGRRERAERRRQVRLLIAANEDLAWRLAWISAAVESEYAKLAARAAAGPELRRRAEMN